MSQTPELHFDPVAAEKLGTMRQNPIWDADAVAKPLSDDIVWPTGYYGWPETIDPRGLEFNGLQDLANTDGFPEAREVFNYRASIYALIKLKDPELRAAIDEVYVPDSYATNGTVAINDANNAKLLGASNGQADYDKLVE